MHAVFRVLMSIYLQIVDYASQLASLLAGTRPIDPDDFATASIILATILIGTGSCVWAVIERLRLLATRYSSATALTVAHANIRFREAVISACPESIAILGRDLSNPTSYRGGSALLKACLEGPDAAEVAAHLDNLMKNGEAFRLKARTAAFLSVSLRGCPVGSRAAVFLRPEENAEPVADFQAALDYLPVPVWIRNRHQVLTWANRAFLAAAGQPTLRDALLADARLDPYERDLAKAASDGVEIVNTRRYVVIGDRRRALSLDLRRLPDASVAGFALDVTETARAEASLQLHTDAFGDLLDHFDHAVAVFDQNRRLVIWNDAFVAMWGLSDEWVEGQPTLGALLDSLRETRRLPEQRNFSGWKRELEQLFAEASQPYHELWHATNGVSIDVSAFHYLEGGVAFVFADVTERLRRETSCNLLVKSQRAILDTVDDAMAAFGTDGRLILHNNAFLRMWRIAEEELAGTPHITRVAELCRGRMDAESIWNLIYSAIASGEPPRLGQWGTLSGADGRALSVSTTRLPQGAILLTFTDITDISRFEQGLHEQTSAA